MSTQQFSNGATRNARFWTFENGGWVKLTLRPDQVLRWGKTHWNGEGWSHEGNAWEHCGDRVVLAWVRRGSDCDGRCEEAGDLECSVDDLAAVAADCDMPARPDWKQRNEKVCRDEFAEAAGY